jgi:hypothetical protein
VCSRRLQSKLNPYRWKEVAWVSMFAYVHSAGWVPFLIAAFSAGNPNESQPIGCSTS